MKSAAIPVIRYADAERAIAWLCAAFGFEVFLKVPGEGGRIEHARLVLGESMVAVASLDRAGAFEQRFIAPAAAGGVTQAVLMMVSDPARIFASAKHANAKIIDDLHEFELGGATFSCADREGHVWVFTSHDHWRKLWE